MGVKIPVTAIVLTKNESLAIEPCVRSLAEFEQVLVVDSLSTDNTVASAIAAGAQVVSFDWNGTYPKKKQWALESSQVRHDWVLFVDADERPTSDLVTAIRAFMESEEQGTAAAAEIQLSYSFMGVELRYGHRVKKRALVHRHRAQFPVVDDLLVSTMWEVEGHYQPIATGAIVQLSGGMQHLDPDPLFDYFARHNRYSDWEAFLVNHPGVRSQVAEARSAQGRIFDRLPAKPVVFFIYSYLLRSGWRDGRAGLDYALALAFYYWQIGAKVRDPNSALR